jgi:hypothetical protein
LVTRVYLTRVTQTQVACWFRDIHGIKYHARKVRRKRMTGVIRIHLTRGV